MHHWLFETFQMLLELITQILIVKLKWLLEAQKVLGKVFLDPTRYHCLTITNIGFNAQHPSWGLCHFTTATSIIYGLRLLWLYIIFYLYFE